MSFALLGVQSVQIYSKDQYIPKQWKKFMSSGKNKESLMAFLCDYWSTCPTSTLGVIQTMYITSREKCIALRRGTLLSHYNYIEIYCCPSSRVTNKPNQ